MTAAGIRVRPGAGYLEARGTSWWLRLSETDVDLATGEIRRRQRRIRVGPRAQLRSRAQARDLVTDWLARRDPESLRPGPDVSFLEYSERFIALHVALMRPTSQRRYRSVIRRHLIPSLAGVRLREVEIGRVQQLVADAAPRMAAATVAGLRAVLLHVLRQAARDGYGAHRINSREVRVPKTSEAPRTPRWITADELERILAASPWPWRALWALMGYAGLRVGEALGMSWADVDFDRRVIRVRQAAVEGQLRPPKTATSQASVPLLPQLADILRDHRATWQPNALNLLFASRTGRPLRAEAVRARRWAPLLADLGLAHAGCHALRHGLPARLSAAGCSSAVIKHVMRHSSSAMTERYTHVGDELLWAQLDAAATRMTTRNFAQPVPASVHGAHGEREIPARAECDAPRISSMTTERETT